MAMRRLFIPIFAAASIFLQQCGDAIEQQADGGYGFYNPVTDNAEDAIPRNIVAYISSPGKGGLSKTTFGYSGNVLSANWKEGDQITMSPQGLSANAVTYSAKNVSGNHANFELQGGAASSSSSDFYVYYYPGKIKNDAQFLNFKYTGQTQEKSDPMAHLANYHTMRFESTEPLSAINFGDGCQSSCMRFVLFGKEFDSPSKIILRYFENGFPIDVFQENNLMSSMHKDGTDQYDGPSMTSKLELGLQGYGVEKCLDAYMMMSSRSVALKKDGVLKVFVECANNESYVSEIKLAEDITLSSGYCHTITITGGWQDGKDSDFKNEVEDRSVYTFQTSSQKNSKLDLVIMGDGFTKAEIESGCYHNIMRQVYEEFFSVEPYSSFKGLWNVYYVNVESAEIKVDEINTSGAKQTEYVSTFKTKFTENGTYMTGDNNLVYQIAKTVFPEDEADERMKNVLAVVMANVSVYAGTCHNNFDKASTNDYGEGQAVAYCALGHKDKPSNRKRIIIHECAGHGFGQLGDEYLYDQTLSADALASKQNDLADKHTRGVFRNLDVYPLADGASVAWNDMLGIGKTDGYDGLYEDFESLGVYEGGWTYKSGFCRPTYNGNMSIMNNNKGQFNAPSRRAIFYRIRCLAGINEGNYSSDAEKDAFYAWDEGYRLSNPEGFASPAPDASSSLGKASRSSVYPVDDDGLMPLAEPQYVSGRWVNGEFVPDNE